ncbi:phage tail tape measure protein [Weissella cibaria]|uniref:phage tail tape measure protein n=1 Tax=Weissella cibaria TaxID=137591 RepID=UPI002A75DAD1|nr:phage tail tape measure protein [Weissella cibaria]MDY2520341.1 phage tail tape measure protein [Weissella cibaria]
MAKEKIAGLVSTEIGLNTAKATQGLNELKSAVKDSTNEWKQMESQMKQSGDEIGASEAKYKGLSQSVEKQQDVLAKLKQEQSEVNRSTEAGEATYQKYASQITTAERQLASMTKQQEQAKRAYELQESGIAGLNKEIQQSIKETDAYVDRLKAEGKEEEANEAQKKGLARTLEKQGQLYEAQRKQLDKMTRSGEASSESISKQKIALDKTGTSIAKGKQSLEELDGAQGKIGKNEGATEAGGKFDKLTGAVGKTHLGLKATVAAAGTALAGVSKLVSAIYDQQSQVSALQAKTTGSYKESKEAISAINKLYAQGYGESVEYLTETYTQLKQMNPKAEVGELAQQTKLVTQYSKASGADTQEVLRGAQNATKAWHMSYQEYFDNLFTLQKQGGDIGGDISDNMAEYSQVLGQMGLSAKDSFSMIANGIQSGAYNGDKLLDFTKEFSISLNDGRMDKSISEFSEKSQKMFNGYKEGKVSAGAMFKQITSEMGKMTDKQKEATLASTLWSALGEDNSLKVLGSLGKQNKAFSDVSGTAKKTSDQLKESNPFELMKRSAEASVSSITMSATETKNFKKTLEPLQKAVKQFIDTMVKNMPAIVKAITPVVNFVAQHGKAVTAVLAGILALHFGSKIVSSASGMVTAFGTLRTGLTKLAESQKVVTASQKAMAVGQKALNMAMATGPWGAVIAGITALVAGFVLLYTHNKKFKKWVDDIVKSAGKFFTSISKWIGSATKTIGKFFTSIGKSLSKAEKSVAKWIGSVSKAISKFFSNLGKWFKGVGKSVGDGASAIGKWFSGFVKGFQKGWNSFVKFATKLLKTFGKIVLISMALPVGIAVTLLKPLIGPMQKLISALAKWLKSVWSPVQKAWSKAWNAIAKLFSSVWNSITKFSRASVKLLHDIVKSQLNAISSTWSKAWNGISKWFSGLLNSITKLWNNTMSAIGNTLNKAMSAISGAWSHTWNGIAKFFTDVWHKMVRTFEPIIKSIQRIVSDTVGAIAGTWNKMWNGIADFFGGIWNKMVRTGDDGIKSVHNVFSPVLDAISSVFSNTWRGITDGFGAMWNDMMSWAKVGINGVIGIINNGIGAINSVIGMFGGSRGLSRIPKFANGTKGAPKGLAVVNDAPGENYQEAIIDNNGKATVLEGRNRLVEFSGGETVIPAHALPKFAGGTDNWLSAAVGWISDKWTQLTSFLREPIVALTNVMNRAVGTITGSPLVTAVAPMMTQGVIHGIATPIVNMLSGIKGKHDNDERQSLLKRLFGKGFAQGGLVSQHGFYEIAEQNMPEIIIPLDPAKKPRANDLLAQANQRINGNVHAKGDSTVNEGDTYSITINVNADLTPGTLQKLQQVVEDAITRKQNAKNRAFG